MARRASPRTEASTTTGGGSRGRRLDPADVRPDGRRRSWLWRTRRAFFAIALLFVLAVGGAGYLFTQVPLPEKDPSMDQTSFFCAADVTADCNLDNSIAQLSGSEDRIEVTYDQLPTVLVQAVLAAEDRTFYDHNGVDPAGIVRALWANFRSESVQQGGSTITQQYVKNVYLSQERTITRKIKEAALAVKLERELPKQEILLRYLNTIYFGRGAYGVEAASRTYFGKTVSDLTLPEAAYLAGLIRAPETADAQLPPEDPAFGTNRAVAEQRRNSVLQAMVETGDITQADADVAEASGWDSVQTRSTRENYGAVDHPEWGTEYVVEYIRRWLVTEGGFSDDEVYGGGLRVYTTLDMGRQEAAMDAVRSTLDRPDDPAAALVSIDDTGAVRAMVGGLDYEGDAPWAKVNLAVGADGGGSGRQPGSSFKMFTLAEALNQGVPLDRVYNAPAKFVVKGGDAGGKDYVVGNYADAGLGQLNLVQATAKSSNTAYVQLIRDVGPQNVAALAQRMGISSELDPVLSLTLGASDVSVYDMASAYSTLASGGVHNEPFVVAKVTDAEGNVLYQHRSSSDRVLAPEVAEGVNYSLNQVVETGTGKAARIDQPVAGKTGTTDNYRDAWFVGFTCKLTTAVWMGYPGTDANGQPRLMENVHGMKVTGGSLPTEIWRSYMDRATDGLESCEFPRPGAAPEPPPTTSARSSTPTTLARSVTTQAPATTAPTTAPPSTTAPTTAAPTTATTIAVGGGNDDPGAGGGTAPP